MAFISYYQKHLHRNNIVNNGQGGGLYATLSQTNLINSSISNNESVDDFGGGIYSIAGNLSIIESLVQGNVTNTRGGAMHIEGPYVSNSRILDNGWSRNGRD